MKSGLTIRADTAQSILDALKTLANKDVLVGIPESKDERDDGDIGNAAIGYINENGSPAQNIPPRPHLKPGVKSVEQDFMPHLKAAAQKALEGNAEGAVTSLDRAGTVAANGVKRYITITGFTPLADATIANRLRRGRTGNKPLIDTGEYRRSITHVVRDKDADT
ncbi:MULTISPECIES: hypothetical protein [Pantoea]|uniref:Bacteriophage protein n=1 Tax=Pantoea latae TaxID=1964541 RepID=A0A1V9DJA1_9GAMM|nr:MULTISPECIES: hypothetical protein [Pantoea]OQP33928.1 hypothetical protein B2J69_10135 [Pantoea latae]UBN53048.1 hypothetical protein LB453_14325 [Pantoea agglomerans]DAI70247.1 MAG TPA: virion morphogenesis protein [Bacteriophage sp.]